MPGSPSSVCVTNSSFCSRLSFRGTGEAGRGISALSPPASLPPVLLYASPGASPLGDPTSLWEVTGGGDTCAACSRSGGRLVLVSCRFVPPRRSSALLPDGSWRLCREPTVGRLLFSLFPLVVIWSWVPRPQGVGGMAACFCLLFCSVWILAASGAGTGLGHSLGAQMSLREVSGDILFLFLFFCTFLDRE